MVRYTAFLVALITASGGAQACGYCIEDKVAAVYDHAVVERAFGEGHHVAFFQIDGKVDRRDANRRQIEALANAAAGVDRGSARVSLEAQTLSVAYDPRRAPFGALHRALEKKLALKKLSLLPLKIMERQATTLSASRPSIASTSQVRLVPATRALNTPE